MDIAGALLHATVSFLQRDAKLTHLSWNFVDLVEAHLIRGSAAEAESLARQIVSEFVAASLNQRAITALGFLTEAIAARSVSRELVIDVREYILSLRTSPEREFAFA